ncbi:MAG: type I methionyl aminopeptidase [Oscillospiraceae bacterium]|nr:type I methionyl aminopeptidase [Oscillospiraceae bacterium]
MIALRTAKELSAMKEACRISAGALRVAKEALRPGVTTAYVDDAVRSYILSQGATPSFLNYDGFPKSVCISINDQIIHGIPDAKTIVEEGDIVSVDVGASCNGYHGDNAATYGVGKVSPEAQRLMDVTAESLRRAIAVAVPGNRIGDIGHAVQSYVEENGFSVVRDYVGHGVGHHLHEDPEVPNYGRPGHGIRLVPGMTIAIEPMVNAGRYDVKVLDNDWTVVTRDGSLSAHFENTIAITDGAPIILTKE